MLTNFGTVTMAMKTKTSLRNDNLIGTVTMEWRLEPVWEMIT